MTCDVPRLIVDDDWLTQHGVIRPAGNEDFRSTLRTDRGKTEPDMSLLLGRLTAVEAGNARLGQFRRRRPDAARHTTAGQLRSVGFRVIHTPRHPGSPLHVSVFWDHGPWDGDVAKRFEACFRQEEEDG